MTEVSDPASMVEAAGMAWASYQMACAAWQPAAERRYRYTLAREAQDRVWKTQDRERLARMNAQPGPNVRP